MIPTQIPFFKKAEENSPSSFLTLEKIFESIKNGENRESIEKVRAAKTDKEKQALKKSLPMVGVSTFFIEGKKRKEGEGLLHSGLLQIDLDHISDAPGERDRIIMQRGCLMACIGPSGDGVKAIFRVADFSNLRFKDFKIEASRLRERHKDAILALQKHLRKEGFRGIDTTANDFVRAMFIPWDPDAKFNPSPGTFPWEKYHKGKVGAHYIEEPAGKEVDVGEYVRDAMARVASMQEGNRNSGCFAVGARMGSFLKDVNGTLEEYQEEALIAVKKVTEDPGEQREFLVALERGVIKGLKGDLVPKTPEAPDRPSMKDFSVEGWEIGSLEEFYALPLNGKHIGIFPTGAGKSYSTEKKAKELAEAGYKVLIMLPDKLSVKNTYRRMADDRKCKVDFCMEDKSSPAKGTKICVTHFHYLLRRGHSNFAFPIVEWVDGKTIIIVDEIDQMVLTMQRDVVLSGVRVDQGKGGSKSYTRCPSQSMNRYLCDQCERCNPGVRWEHGDTVPIIGLRNQQKGSAKHPEFLSEWDPSGFGKEEVIHQSAMLDISRRRYLQKPLDLEKVTVGVPDDAAPGEWIQKILDYSGYAYKIRGAKNRREEFRKAAEEERRKYYASRSDEESNIKPPVRALLNARIKRGDLEPFPYYSCDSELLHFFDSSSFNYILGRACGFYGLTATLTEQQYEALNTLSQFDVYRGPSMRKTIDDLLIITTPLKLGGFAKDQERWGTTLVFMESKEKCDAEGKVATNLKKKVVVWNPDQGFGYHYSDNIQEGGDQNMLLSYSRSSIARGVNLPKYKTVVAGLQSFKPSLHYALHEDEASLREAREEELVSLVSQQVGRVLRVKEGEENPRRVIVVHSCISEDGDDLSEAVSSMLKDRLGSMVKNIHSVFVPVEKTVSENHNSNAIIMARNDFLLEGKINDSYLKGSLPYEVYKCSTYVKAKKKYKALPSVIDEDEWYLNRQRIIIEEFCEDKDFMKLKPRARQIKLSWSKLKLKVPGKLYETYETLLGVTHHLNEKKAEQLELLL